MRSDVLEGALYELAHVIVADLTLRDALTRVTESVKSVVPQAVAVGITMANENGRLSTPIYTDEISPQVDAAQYAADAGPCLDAWREQRVIHVEDTAQVTPEYQEFGRAAIEHGIQSTLSLPLVAADRALGGLNLYAQQVGSFSEADAAAAATLTAAASVMLANSSAYWEARTLGEHLDEAMKSRAVIEQAKGMVMALHHDIDEDGAFDVLRQISQVENIKLRDVASRLVEQRRLPGVTS